MRRRASALRVCFPGTKPAAFLVTVHEPPSRSVGGAASGAAPAQVLTAAWRALFGTNHVYRLSDHEIQCSAGRRKARRTREGCGTHFRLLKKTHLLRWLTRALVAAYLEYASLGPACAALHLGPF